MEIKQSLLVRFLKRGEVWLLFVALIPRLLALDVFLTADEPLFLDQARQFAAGLSSGDFSRTMGIGYPGVTLAWWTAPVVGLTHSDLGAYVAGRIVTALVNALLLLLLYRLARPLLGPWPALLGVGLLALDPYTMAYSRLLHIEMPLALLMTLAGLSYLLWLDSPRRQWLLLAGLFSGLALLTKSTALLLGPMLVALLIGWIITQNVSGVRCQVSGVRYQVTFQELAGLLIIALLASALFFALWPAMWIDPAGALGLTFGKLLTDQEAGTGNYGMFWLGRFVQDPGPFFYPLAFLLKATPWLLFGLGLSLWQLISFYFWSRKHATRNTQHAIRTLPLWLFALTYLLLMTIASKKSIRYLLPAFPTFYLLAGLALVHFSQSIRQRISRWPKLFSPLLLRSSAPLLVFLFTLLYHPYYFTYNNPLLLGWLWAPRALLVGWGEGLDEAGRYLNQQPPGVVAAWYEWLFPLYYHGQVQPTSVDNLLTADHTVLYINQVQRNLPNPNVITYFRRRQPEYTVRLSGIEYAWVYPGPVIGFRPDPAPQVPLGGEFGSEVKLLGYDLSPAPLSGQPLVITFYWRVLAMPPAERYVYLRLVDAQGRIWARADSPPVMGFWSVSRLEPDMLIEDAQELPIPPGTPPGTYRLEAGWYDSASGQTLPATGQPLGGGGGLLLGEIHLGWQSLSVSPDLPHQTDTPLAPNAHLVGYEAPPPAATTGDVLPLHLAWRKASSLWDFTAVPNNFVMFEWRQGQRASAEQIDPLPFPIEEWGRDALLRSQHEVIVPPTLAAGRYELAVMLHTGSDPAGEAFLLGWVEVASPPHQFDLPASARLPAAPAQLEPSITLAGYETRLTPQALELKLYWQTEAPLTNRYKVFAQLLTPDNTLLAQSDTFPAGDQRPTTGWLPGEIITDAHTLTFSTPPASGKYRLIAGLYDPLTGQRLSLLNEQAQPISDAIIVAEITLP